MSRDKVFISYSRRDKLWLERLQKMLKPLVRGGTLDLWADTEVKAGDNWKEEIKRALGQARVAVLLVSADFLASDFVIEEELPPLLQGAEEKGVKILWIYLSPCHYRETPIAGYQAAHDVAESLLELPLPKQERALLEISRRIQGAIAEAERLAEQERKRLADVEAKRQAEEKLQREETEKRRQAEAEAISQVEKKRLEEATVATLVSGEVVTSVGEVPEEPRPSPKPRSKAPRWLTVAAFFAVVIVLAVILRPWSKTPTASLEAQPRSIELGAAATLSWITNGADEVQLEPDIGVVEARGTKVVTPERRTMYRILARGDGGEAQDYAVVQVTEKPPPPTQPSAILKAKPTSIEPGQSTTLTWATSGANEVRLEPELGSVESKGSKKVSPAAETTYRLVARGAGGEAEDSTVVRVTSRTPARPTAILKAKPTAIELGQLATLTWTTTGANQIQLEPGLGSVQPQGSKTISPTLETSYKLIAEGAGGLAEDSVVIKVIAKRPTASLAAEPQAIEQGQETTLQWTTTNATEVRIDPGLGLVEPKGAKPVSLEASTAYMSLS